AERGALPLDAALALARAEVAAGDRQAAERHLAAAVERTGSVRATMMLGRLQAERGDEAAALATVRTALAAAPNSEEVVSAYARLSLATGAPAPALRALEALVRMHPEVAEHHYLLGVSLIQLGDLARARAVLEEAIRLAPDQPRAHTVLGLVLNRLSHFAEAKSALAAALRLAPDDLDALAALAEAEEGSGELESAERRARRVLARAPGHATAWLVLGLVLMENERYAEARDALLAAVAAEPSSVKAHYQLSLAYARLGDRARSAEHAELSRRARREADERAVAAGGTPPGGMGP
ncbi:MAG TPA: tetratricopeptide repeat protein, partial [Thermoanaerobaculia bacterium]|nr:tetratricopeptide repeat protein [Thermoanaerobaculia bacterium]